MYHSAGVSYQREFTLVGSTDRCCKVFFNSRYYHLKRQEYHLLPHQKGCERFLISTCLVMADGRLEIIKEGPWETGSSDVNPPLLLLHGFPDGPELYDEIAPHFLSQGRRLLRVAWPNCGSLPELKWGLDFPDIIRELISILENLDSSVDILAHDWGAGFAWSIEKGRPDLVHRLVAVDVSGSLPTDARSCAFTALYQIPLVICFLIGGPLGNTLCRLVVNELKRPLGGSTPKASKAYPYYYLWKRFFANPRSGSVDLKPKLPSRPALYIYGKKKVCSQLVVIRPNVRGPLFQELLTVEQANKVWGLRSLRVFVFSRAADPVPFR